MMVTGEELVVAAEHIRLLEALHPPGTDQGFACDQLQRFQRLLAMMRALDDLDDERALVNLVHAKEAEVAHQRARQLRSAAAAAAAVPHQDDTELLPEDDRIDLRNLPSDDVLFSGRGEAQSISGSEREDDEEDRHTNASGGVLVDMAGSSTTPVRDGGDIEPDPAYEWRLDSTSRSASPHSTASGGGGGVGSSVTSPRVSLSSSAAAAPTGASATSTTITTTTTTTTRTTTTTTSATMSPLPPRPLPSSSRVPPPVLPPSFNPDSYPKWRPSALALQADCNPPKPADGRPTKHHLCLHVRTVMRKPHGYDAKDEAMKQQGLYCKGCLCELKPKFRALRLGKSWDTAKFCSYTGYYYCTSCHPSTETSVIPARVLNYWDFTPMSVCSDAKSFIEMHSDAPLLCVSAVNPKLYDLLPVLRSARGLRLQLNILRDIGIMCPQFRQEFYGETLVQEKTPVRNLDDVMARVQPRSSSSSTTSHVDPNGKHHRAAVEEEAHIIPLSRRYLVEDSEFWSLTDLMEINSLETLVQKMDAEEMKRMKEAWAVDANGKLNSSSFRSLSFQRTPASPVQPAAANNTASSFSATPQSDVVLGDSELTRFLKQTRTNMIRHVVQICRRGDACCFRRAAQACPLCKKKDLIYLFDLNRTRTCTRCGSCYHRECWARRKGHHTACVVCVDQMVAAASPGSPLPEEERETKGTNTK